MNQPALAHDKRFATAAARRTHREDINTMVAAWTVSQEVSDLTRLLQAQDIASGPVLNSKDLFINEHLQHRGFYERVEHPAPIGPRPIIGRPYRLRFRDAHIKKAGPRFGEDNDAILRDILGMTPEQIAEVKANKVVCDLPTNPGISGTMDTDMMLRLGTLSAVDKDYRSIMGVDR
jgi:crotonobetainyl-CoA:carnitine CoA-transferase CaiB-like acyl-CoA transferase